MNFINRECCGVSSELFGGRTASYWSAYSRTAANLAANPRKVCRATGVSFPTINRWENGHATPSPLALKQIDSLLNQLAASPEAALRVRGQAIREKYCFSRTRKA